jgi:hypothetical protein
MAGKLTARRVESLSKRKGRYLDGNGLFMRVLGPNKSYWVYRYRVHGVDREMSIGNPQFMTLVEARAKHLEMRAIVAKGGDPVGERQKGRAFAKVLHRADAPILWRSRRCLPRLEGQARQVPEQETQVAMGRDLGRTARVVPSQACR